MLRKFDSIQAARYSVNFLLTLPCEIIFNLLCWFHSKVLNYDPIVLCNIKHNQEILVWFTTITEQSQTNLSQNLHLKIEFLAFHKLSHHFIKEVLSYALYINCERNIYLKSMILNLCRFLVWLICQPKEQFLENGPGLRIGRRYVTVSQEDNHEEYIKLFVFEIGLEILLDLKINYQIKILIKVSLWEFLWLRGLIIDHVQKHNLVEKKIKQKV